MEILSDKKNVHFYDGLGETTTGSSVGLFSENYPVIEETALKDIFKL